MEDIEEMEIIFYLWREIKNIDNLNFREKNIILWFSSILSILSI